MDAGNVILAEAFSLPASDTHVVDSTGAGDNFAAGFYDAYLAGASFLECGEAGIRQAAKSLGHAGATELEGENFDYSNSTKGRF